MGCFGNPIVVSGSILCNILYCIVELFSLIRGCRHGWPNHVKTSCTVCVIVLSLCSWTNIVGIKAFAGTTTAELNRIPNPWETEKIRENTRQRKTITRTRQYLRGSNFSAFGVLPVFKILLMKLSCKTKGNRSTGGRFKSREKNL